VGRRKRKVLAPLSLTIVNAGNREKKKIYPRIGKQKEYGDHGERTLLVGIVGGVVDQ